MSQQPGQGGLSVQTLIIASLASLTAAIVVHEIWAGGAILGAAITPIIVALTSEALRKPTQKITSLREERVTRPREAAPARSQRPAVPPPAVERPDPFGIWSPDGRSWRDRLGRRHLRIALITGLVAFAIGAVALTGTELLVGGSLGGGGDRVTILPGTQKKRDRDRDRTRGPEQPAQRAPAAPQEQPAPDQTPPTPPQGAEPPTTAAPGATAPQASPGAQTPAP